MSPRPSSATLRQPKHWLYRSFLLSRRGFEPDLEPVKRHSANANTTSAPTPTAPHQLKHPSVLHQTKPTGCPQILPSHPIPLPPNDLGQCYRAFLSDFCCIFNILDYYRQRRKKQQSLPARGTKVTPPVPLPSLQGLLPAGLPFHTPTPFKFNQKSTAEIGVWP